MRIIPVLLALTTATTAVAQPNQTPLTFVQAGKWPEAEAAAALTGDKLVEKLIRYYRMLTPGAARATDIAEFARQNPDWPLPSLLERRRLEALIAEPDNAVVAAQCVEKKPTPAPARAQALLRCAEALASVGKAAEAADAARTAWVQAISDPGTEAAFLRKYPGLIAAEGQWARFQRLAWDDLPGAQRQIAQLDPARAAQAAARLALKSNNTAYLVTPENEPGAMLDLARAYRRLGQNDAAVALWRTSGAAAQKAAPDHLDGFWSERHLLTRKLLQEGNSQGAYTVVSGHGQKDPAVVVEAEFLAGFIALRRLNDPRAAVRHFTALAAASPAVLTQSRAQYWLGRAQVASGGDGRAAFARAAAWPMTFYGQLGARASLQPEASLLKSLRAEPTPTNGLSGTPVSAELAQSARLLAAWSDQRRARPFLLRLEEAARTPAERIAAADFATSLGMPDITVLITRRLGRDGIMPPLQGWPAPVEPPAALVEPSVSLAIMRQESNFDVGIVSSAGARGLMQLMPATAQSVARRLREPTSLARLTTDSGHNMRLGTAYLREVMEKFDNSVPMAAAAYNAGPHRVTQWITENGDPRAADQSMIDWIEMIPFNETRNYVQRVLENIVVYQARRTGTLPDMMPQWSK